jgi:hypothetical protein
MRKSKVWISIVILLILGLHALPVLSYQGHRQTRWPFLAWAMYAKSFPPGPIQTVKRRIVGRTFKGETTQLTGYLVGVPTPTLRNAYIKPLLAGDSTAARELLSRLNRDREDPFVEVWVEGEQHTLTDSGIVKENFRGTTFRVHSSDKIGS